MSQRKGIALILTALWAISGMALTGHAGAEEYFTSEKLTKHHLKVIVVEGVNVLPGGYIAANGKVGILGDISVIEIPFTQRKYTEKAISDFCDPNQALNGVLANNPSIRIGSPSAMYTDFRMRGVNMNGSHYYINGIPNMFNQTRSIPAHVLESVEIVSGPNTVLNGATFSANGTNNTDAPAGMLNGITKRAQEKPITRYTQKFSGRSNWTEQIDIGRRFGNAGEWGVRVNAQYEKGGLSMQGADVKDTNIYLNLDHKDKRSTTNILCGYFDWEINGGQRWLHATAVNKGHLPVPPNAKTNLSFAGQTKQNHGYLFTLNHVQKLNDKWNAFVNGGYAKYNEHKWDPNGGSLTLKDDGILSGRFRDFLNESTSSYWQIGLSNETQISKAVKNNLSVAADWYKFRGHSLNTGNAKGQAKIEGDLWNGVHIVGTPIYAGSIKDVPYSREEGSSLTVADRLEIGKASVYGALQYRDTVCTSSSGHSVSKDCVNPTFALSYKPIANLSIYASYAESYTRPVEVGTSYSNAGEIFKPIKNKQNEFGIKYANGGVLHGIAFFDLNQASYIRESTGGPLDKLTQNGENRYKGIEYSISGKVASKWNIMGGFMYLNAKREHLTKGSEHLEGLYITGTPKWNAVLAAGYEADKNNSTMVRANFVGGAHFNDNGIKTPSYTTIDLGYKHKTMIHSVPVALSAMCYNVMGKNYWISRGTLGAPRSLMLAVQFDL